MVSHQEFPSDAEAVTKEPEVNMSQIAHEKPSIDEQPAIVNLAEQLLRYGVLARSKQRRQALASQMLREEWSQEDLTSLARDVDRRLSHGKVSQYLEGLLLDDRGRQSAWSGLRQSERHSAGHREHHFGEVIELKVLKEAHELAHAAGMPHAASVIRWRILARRYLELLIYESPRHPASASGRKADMRWTLHDVPAPARSIILETSRNELRSQHLETAAADLVKNHSISQKRALERAMLKVLRQVHIPPVPPLSPPPALDSAAE